MTPRIELRQLLTAFFALGLVSLVTGRSWGDDAPTRSWPLTPLVRPAVPKVTADSPIDAFIVEKLSEKGLRLSPRATRLALLKRITFDLTGLLPTTAEQDAYVNDGSPQATERVVDRLLASPQFGERWAQHWLDVVRYAETDGFKSDSHREFAYKYRDFVIQAYNSDMPYDEFVRQQIAGDELDPHNPQSIIATGYNRLYPDELEASNYVTRRQDLLDDVTDVTGQAFMGLTIGCARCHDHKFDPISQADFFSLQAFFAPMVPHDDVEAATPEEHRQYVAAQQRWEDASAAIRAEIDKLLDKHRADKIAELTAALDPLTQEALHTPAERRTPYQEQLVIQSSRMLQTYVRVVYRRLEGAQEERYFQLRAQLKALNKIKPDFPGAMTVQDVGNQAPPTYILATGNVYKPQQQVQPAFLHAIDSKPPVIVPPLARPNSTGRRSALAKWLTRPEHPLTARVMANRIWQNLLGEGIVGTPNDFGAMGEGASHQELLDWLAAEFIADGWRVKSLVRKIVLSDTYAQTTDFDKQHDAPAITADPNNKLLWHARRKRLQGESVRDQMMQISGMLNARMLGPSVRPKLPTNFQDAYAWDPDEDTADHYRRSIYIVAKRNMKFPMMDAFDQPDLHNSCARRCQTTTAPQALTLLNGEFSIDQAKAWSGRLLRNYSDRNELIKAAYRQVMGRSASEKEIAGAIAFLDRQAAAIRESSTAEQCVSHLPDGCPANVSWDSAAAVLDFCHALLNSNEFLYVE